MKIKNILILVALASILSSCASVHSPLFATHYTNVKSPVAVTGNTGATKVGSAQAVSYLGIVALGDASIEKAAKDGGITKIHHVDQESFSVLAIFAKYTVYVYGE